ncbi:MAG: class I SAM-dependent methyltransferase [Candidatus Marinimicrobia bacterium]|nr:class I SAM-dependent methyltransferase [Candidatus Neomarinimicrobiota bacterium]
MFENLYVELAKSAKVFYGQVADEIKEKIEKDGNIFSLLDVGSGPGDLILALLKRVPWLTIFAVDISEKIIDVAQQRAKDEGCYFSSDIFFEVQDALKLNYPNDSFDFVVSCGDLHAFKNPAEAIREWVRVLRPGHELWIYDPTPLIKKEDLVDSNSLKLKLPNWKDRVSFFVARMLHKGIPPGIFSAEDVFEILDETGLSCEYAVISKEDYIKIIIKKS